MNSSTFYGRRIDMINFKDKSDYENIIKMLYAHEPLFKVYDLFGTINKNY